MKRTFALMLALLLLFSLAACTPSAPPPADTSKPADPASPTAEPSVPDPAPADTDEGFPLALITDLGTIDDKSFNQGSWEGLVQYAEEAGIAHKYYQPSEQSDDAYLATIDLAVQGGAKLIVTPGFLFEVPIWNAQDLYPDVHFVLVDGTPHNPDYSDTTIRSNVVGITYAEEQAGFLAGYAAVKDGNTKLGFMGGMAVPAVVRFGYGYIQGAEYAAQELSLGANSVTLNYHYTGAFDATPEVQAMAASWYNDGVEIIFGCGGAVGNSVMAAASEHGKKVIGVDIDQSGESDTVITSSMKGLRASVYDCVKAYGEGTFPGGQHLVFGADNNGVGLPMETSKFATFSQADYDAIYAKLAGGEISLVADLKADGTSNAVTDVPVAAVAVTEIS